jgi:hypothetical protein
VASAVHIFDLTGAIDYRHQACAYLPEAFTNAVITRGNSSNPVILQNNQRQYVRVVPKIRHPYYENEDQPSVSSRELIERTPVTQTNITIGKTINVDIDLSQSSIPSISTSRLSRKRPFKSPESSTSEDDDLSSKRSRTRRTGADPMPALFQRWEVVGISNVTLDDGSGRCYLHWKDTEISESNIRDKVLLEKFKDEAKKKYGGQSG